MRVANQMQLCHIRSSYDRNKQKSPAPQDEAELRKPPAYQHMRPR